MAKKFYRGRCRNCSCYRPSLKYSNINYCSMNICYDAAERLRKVGLYDYVKNKN